MGARPADVVEVDGLAAAKRASHGGHLGLVAIGPDSDGHAPGEVDAVDPGEKAVDEVLPRLLAVRDDVDAGRLLKLERDQDRVALAFGQSLGGQAPWRPERLRRGQPRGFRKTSGDRRLEHGRRY